MKVIIVGGVAGGASCAARLRRLDERAQIILVERGPYVSYANCGLPYHIGGVIEEESSLLVSSPEALRSVFDIDCRTGCDPQGPFRRQQLAADDDERTDEHPEHTGIAKAQAGRGADPGSQPDRGNDVVDIKGKKQTQPCGQRVEQRGQAGYQQKTTDIGRAGKLRYRQGRQPVDEG